MGAKDIIDAFVRRTKIDGETGYVEPQFMYTTRSSTRKYGWEAKCPDCKYVLVISEVHP
jgi:hypothetical protein